MTQRAADPIIAALSVHSSGGGMWTGTPSAAARWIEPVAYPDYLGLDAYATRRRTR